ncbi:MAG: sigma 54-interacting transcriptional regulator [Rickettsiales bacterium]|nr:sigma 54-interacting transcriptional regulator [Rickettsiales bacterium]
MSDTKKPTILIADDDEAIGVVLSQALRRAGYEPMVTHNLPTLMEWVEEGLGDVVITDIMMPSGNGLDALPVIQKMRPELPIIVISAQNSLMTAVKTNELGAFDYLPKPFDLDDVIASVGRALSDQPHEPEQPTTLEGLDDDAALIGHSASMQDVFKVIARLIHNDLMVMVHGESGTGKEMVARALHKLSPRKDAPFIVVNMASIPEDQIERELFGDANHEGRFLQAKGGTLYLDEVGDMPAAAQNHLLRILQQGDSEQADVRIISSTHRDLESMIRDGSFREDLYYRLNVVPVRIPPLRDRRDDIPELVQHFLHKATGKGLPKKQLEDAALNVMHGHDWPGNVRELENLIYRLCALCSASTVDAEMVSQELRQAAPIPSSDASSNVETLSYSKATKAMPNQARGGLEHDIHNHLRAYFDAHPHALPPDGLYDRVLEVVERPLIEETLRATDGNQLRAAKVLGINRNTLRKKITQLGIGRARREMLRRQA